MLNNEPVEPAKSILDELKVFAGNTWIEPEIDSDGETLTMSFNCGNRRIEVCVFEDGRIDTMRSEWFYWRKMKDHSNLPNFEWNTINFNRKDLKNLWRWLTSDKNWIEICEKWG